MAASRSRILLTPAPAQTAHRVGTLVSLLALTAGLLTLAPSARADDMNTVLGGGVGAAAGAVLGQSMGGRQGAVIGGALGGATGAAVTTRGSGQNGAIIGGAVGGAAGAAVGGSAGGRNGAILGAGVGGAAGATIGKGVTQHQPGGYAEARDPRYQTTYRPEPVYVRQGYERPGYDYGRDDRHGWRDDRRHDNGHHYGHGKHHDRGYEHGRDGGRD